MTNPMPSHAKVKFQKPVIIRRIKEPSNTYVKVRKGYLYSNTNLNKKVANLSHSKYKRITFKFTKKYRFKRNGKNQWYGYITNGKVSGWVYANWLVKVNDPRKDVTPAKVPVTAVTTTNDDGTTNTGTGNTQISGTNTTNTITTTNNSMTSQDAFNLTEYRSKFLSLLNYERENRGLQPIKEDDQYDRIAQEQVYDDLAWENQPHYTDDEQPDAFDLAESTNVSGITKTYEVENSLDDVLDDDSGASFPNVSLAEQLANFDVSSEVLNKTNREMKDNYLFKSKVNTIGIGRVADINTNKSVSLYVLGIK
ncbi:hypothetical protein [Lentilactobacillus kosonis]|nr:hypothetical protein [Lentilactobacillus kosonis]